VDAETLRKTIDRVTGNGGAANKANILAWQQWYNDKHPNSPIKADGILGRQTLTAMGLRSSQ
jgi:lysozyme family protein